MAKDINKYAQNIARARYASPTSRAPQRRATIDPTLFTGKTAAKGAPLASRAVEGGPELPSPQEYNPMIDAESGEDPNAPRVETQQPIENRGSSARYMIQGGGPKIDLSFLVPERANAAYDPSKAIGGENVPYQESKGVGGFFRRMLGDESNRMNIEAQQAQGAEWKAEDTLAKRRAEKKADLAEEIALREAGPTKRFEISQTAADKAEANRVAAENKRLELEGQRLGLTKQQIEDARQDRIDRLKGEQADREARIEDMRTRNALSDAAFGRSMLPSAQAISTGQGGVLMYDPRSGQPIGTFSSPTIGEITNPKTGEKSFGPTGGGYEPYAPPVTVPKDLPPSPEVDRTTGAAPGAPRKETMGGPLSPSTADNAPAEPARFGPFLMEEFQKRAQTLAKESGSRPNATDPLMLPMYENMAKSLGVEPEGIGASRQVRRPAAAIVEKDLNSYMNKFGQLPTETQNAAVIDALNKSMKQPRYRTMPNWEYNYNAQ